MCNEITPEIIPPEHVKEQCAISPQENQPWLQLPDEPERWFARFDYYCRSGMHRSLIETYRYDLVQRGLIDKVACVDCLPGSWQQAVARYHWQDRVAAYDRQAILIQRHENEKLRLEVKQERIDAMRDLLRKSHEALMRLSLDDETLSSVSSAMKAAVRGLHTEFEPVDSTGDVSITYILNVLPADLRELLRARLSE